MGSLPRRNNIDRRRYQTKMRTELLIVSCRLLRRQSLLAPWYVLVVLYRPSLANRPTQSYHGGVHPNSHGPKARPRPQLTHTAWCQGRTVTVFENTQGYPRRAARLTAENTRGDPRHWQQKDGMLRVFSPYALSRGKRAYCRTRVCLPAVLFSNHASGLGRRM